VLDVASGKGDFIKVLVKSLKSYLEIIGIDVTRYTEAAGGIFPTEDVRFIQMDAAQLGFSDESFDTVSISSSLHHLENIPLCIGEMMRVLKAGGHIIIRETHQDIQAAPQLTDMQLHHWVAEVDSALGGTHNKTFTRQQIIELAKGLKLRCAEFYDIANTDTDPRDKAAIKGTEAIIDRYMRRAAGLLDDKALRRRGEELLRRLHRVGIQWEPELIIIGEKR
jgi:SAM-dependent methyltransferase